MGNKKDKKKAAKKADKKLKGAAKAKTVARKAADAVAAHPAVAEVVAAALVGAAAALKNPRKARALAESAGDSLEKLGKEAAGKGSALWSLALEVGRRSLETLDLAPEKKAEKLARSAAPKRPAAPRKPPAKKVPARKPAARKAPAKKT